MVKIFARKFFSIVLELHTYFETGWKIQKLLLRSYYNVSVSPDRIKSFKDALHFCLFSCHIYSHYIFSFFLFPLPLCCLHYRYSKKWKAGTLNVGRIRKKSHFPFISGPKSRHICYHQSILKLSCKILTYLAFWSYWYANQHINYLLQSIIHSEFAQPFLHGVLEESYCCSP